MFVQKINYFACPENEFAFSFLVFFHNLISSLLLAFLGI